jgi:7-carboxy-7-deazaguanine synthase
LVDEFKKIGKYITVETAGIAYIADMTIDLMSISPKLSNSTPHNAKLAAIHENSRLSIEILTKLVNEYNYQIKFVVNSEDDLLEIQQIIEKIGNVDSDKVMLMPQARTRDELLAKSPMVAELCKRKRRNHEKEDFQLSNNNHFGQSDGCLWG